MSKFFGEINIALGSKYGLWFCDGDGLHVETRTLRCALTQQYASTFRAFTLVVSLWSYNEKVLARFPLCIERV